MIDRPTTGRNASFRPGASAAPSIVPWFFAALLVLGASLGGASLLAPEGMQVTVTVDGLADEPLEAARHITGIERLDRTDDELQVLTKSSGSILGALITTLESAGAHVTSVSVREPDLESVFLHLTGKSLRD